MLTDFHNSSFNSVKIGLSETVESCNSIKFYIINDLRTLTEVI